MARRPSRRLIDVVFATALLACGIAAAMTGPAQVPDELCSATGAVPRYDTLLADQRVTVAVVLSELDDVRHRAWTHDRLVRMLRARGFRLVAPDRYERAPFIVDITLLPDDKPVVAATLTSLAATHEVLYYNGHSGRGSLQFTAPDTYRVLFLDSCWTTQYMSANVVDGHDVISNSERSITGSVESFGILLDGFEQRDSWDAMLATLNERALARRKTRVFETLYKDPEQYRLDVRCSAASRR